MENKKEEFSAKLKELMTEYGFGLVATPIIAPVNGVLTVVETQFAIVESKKEEQTEQTPVEESK